MLVVFTKRKLFRHKWGTAKFILTIGLVLFGMFFNEHRILMNIELLENTGSDALLNPVFSSNHDTLKMGMVGASDGFVLLIVIAVFKPWMKKAESIA